MNPISGSLSFGLAHDANDPEAHAYFRQLGREALSDLQFEYYLEIKKSFLKLCQEFEGHRTLTVLSTGTNHREITRVFSNPARVLSFESAIYMRGSVNDDVVLEAINMQEFREINRRLIYRDGVGFSKTACHRIEGLFDVLKKLDYRISAGSRPVPFTNLIYRAKHRMDGSNLPALDFVHIPQNVPTPT